MKYQSIMSSVLAMNAFLRIQSSPFDFSLMRTISTSPILLKTSAGKHKITKYKTKPLTYEMAQFPQHIGVRKSWLTWHTSNLEGFGIRQGRTVAEDEIIRRFVRGIWHDLFTDEVIIKRRGNIIIVAGLVYQKMPVRKYYWLLGFTEELLGYILKQPVKFEIQSVLNREDVVYKYI